MIKGVEAAASDKSVWIFHPYATLPDSGGLLRPNSFSAALMESGYRPTIFASSYQHFSGGNMIEDGARCRVLIDNGLPFVFVRNSSDAAGRLSRLRNILEYCIRLPACARRYAAENGRPGTILASSPHLFACVAGIRIAKRYGCQCIVEIRDLWPLSIVSYGLLSAKNPAIKLLFLLERWVYRRADAIVFTMEGGRDYLIARGLDKAQGGPVDLGKVHHINNGIELARFDENRRLYRLADADLDDPDSFKAVYAGSVRLVNHLDSLLDAAAVLHAEGNRHIRILIYGEGTEKARLMERARREGLDNVVFKGPVQKKYIPYILSKCDLNLMHGRPTELFAYGASLNKSFDYLASGKPTLANFDFRYNYITQNGGGRCEVFASAEDYAQAILSFADMPDEDYRAMCVSARDTAALYDFRVLTDRLIGVIEGADAP